MKLNVIWRISMLSGALSAAACGGTIPSESDRGALLGKKKTELRIISRNMYVGTDVDAVQAVTDPNQIPFAVADAWQMLLATHTEERIAAMADEIVAAEAHLVGLQEVSLIRTQTPGDLVLGGTTPAEEVAYDFLPLLLDALDARGAHYRVAAMIEDSDVEAPRINADYTFTDVRLTDFDAILAREDVGTSNPLAQRFDRSAQAGLFTVLRGYVAVDATLGGTTYRFVNTHLEPVGSDATVQRDQAQQLIGALEGEACPLIVVGDFNTSENAASPTYQMFLGAGFRDLWFDRIDGGGDPGYTASHDPDLRNELPHLTTHIDIVFARNLGRSLVRADIIGDEVEDKTPSGLWPSDHAGVSVRISQR